MKVLTHQSFDEIGNPLPGGLYDMAMGPFSRNDNCKTCYKRFEQCGGHFGYIELCLPVYNPFFIKVIYNILRISCLSCYKLQVTENTKIVTELQLRLLSAGYVVEAEELEICKLESNSCIVKIKMENGSEVHPKVAEYYEMLLNEPVNLYNNCTKSSESIKNAIITCTLSESQTKSCIYCKQAMKRVKFSYKRLVFGVTKADMKSFYQNQDEKSEHIKAANLPILADECKEYLRKIWEENSSFLSLLFPVLDGNKISRYPTDRLFMDLVPVTPPVVRPVNTFSKHFNPLPNKH